MKNPPDGWPRIVPAAFYDDAAAAIDWLTRAFGFVVRERVEDDRGRIVHSQLVLNGGVIMVGQIALSPERPRVRSPAGPAARTRRGWPCSSTTPATKDYGEGYWADRSYEAEDPEGHHWWFMQRLRG